MRTRARRGLLGLALLLCASSAAAAKGWPGLASKHNRAEDEEIEAREPLSAEELRQRLPDLRTRAEPRRLQGSLGFGTRFLYLLLGVEGTLDAYPAPWLRVGLVYGAGLSFKWDGEKATGAFAQYGEAMAGLRFWSSLSQTDADLQLRRSVGNYGDALPLWARPKAGDFADVLPVWLPSSHHLFAEGGALTAHVGFKECTSNCEPFTAPEPQYRALTRQLLIPFAGIRYVYYSEALNAQPPVNRVHYGQLFAHVLFGAFNRPSVQAYYLSNDKVDTAPLGMRVGGELPVSPFCAAALLGGRCAQGSITFGYTPYPAYVTAEIHLRFPIR